MAWYRCEVGGSGGESGTASGEIATFSIPNAIKSVIADIVATQEGSGTPSPSNVRPISGFSKVTIHNNSTEVEVQLGQTVYGGSLNVTTGELTITHGKVVLDGTQALKSVNWQPKTNTRGWIYEYSVAPFDPVTSSTLPDAKCDSLPIMTYASAWGDNQGVALYTSAYYGLVVRVADTSLETAEAINAYLAENPITVVYPLATPITVQLSATTVRAVAGVNNVWADSGEIEVEYSTISEGGATTVIPLMSTSVFKYVENFSGTDVRQLAHSYTALQAGKLVFAQGSYVNTNTGSNDGYLSIEVNGTEVYRQGLTTDTDTTLANLADIEVSASDVVEIYAGFANAHTRCRFSIYTAIAFVA